MTTDTCICPNCGDEHDVEHDDSAEKESAAYERSFHTFTSLLDLTYESRVVTMEQNGRTWITNGYIAVAPERVAPGNHADRAPITPAEKTAKTLSGAPADYVRLTPGPKVEETYPDARPLRRFDGAAEPIHVQERYYAVLADCDDWRGNGVKDPVYAYKDGVFQGVIMPILVFGGTREPHA